MALVLASLSLAVAQANATAQAVDDVYTLSSPVSGDTYERGEVIRVGVLYDDPVDVVGTPQLALGIGSQTRQASFASGTRTGIYQMEFHYTVVQADVDTDGISVGANALSLNGGTIKRAGGTGNAFTVIGGNGFTNSSGHKVDGGRFTAAAVSGAAITSSPAGSSTYGLSEQIEVAVTFTRPVTVSGRPQLALVIGSATRQAAYASSTATTLTFRYTVQAADSDADGLSVGASALGLNSGTINDARDGTTAASLGLGTNAITNSSGHKVDGTRESAPGVTGVAIGAPGVGDTFERGEAIEVTVTFNKVVDVSGTPQLALGIGAQTRQASYASGTGTASLVFRYVVVQADADNDGLSIGADALGLNSGTIDVAGGTANALLGLGASAIENSGSHKVAGGTFTASAVSGAAVASTPSSGSTYGLGEQIEVRLTFSRAVTVSGAPQLALGVGTATRQAGYASSPSTATVLVFRYTVQAADSDADGLSVGASALGLNSGTINDARDGTTAASLGLSTNAITNDGGHKVDGSQGPPGVTGVAIGSPVVGDTFEHREAIDVTVTFNKAVVVTGTPQLALGIGTATRQASYASGTGTASLVFRYTVALGDADSDGVSIGADALGLNNGTIDVAGGTTDALLGLGANAITNSTGHKVNGAPKVTGVLMASPVVGDTFELGELIWVQVQFSALVDVGGTPQLALGIGAQTRQADYAWDTGGLHLTFLYTVQASDVDIDGISVAATALTLNGGRIDVAGGTVDALLGLGTHAVTNDRNRKVDGASVTAPRVAFVVMESSPVSGDTYERDEVISVRVAFDRAVDVGGTPQLALGIGAQTRQASYASGTGPPPTALVFRYTVVSGDADSDGVSIGADALGLNSGTIDVAGGTTDALLGLGSRAIENNRNHKVAGGTLTASAVNGAAIASSPASGSTYGLGEQIEVAVTFTRLVTVSGTPQLALGIGTETRQANYVSGTGTDSLTFRYAVIAADSDADGLSVGASALGLNSGTINDARDGTTAASLGLGTNAIANDGDHKVDGTTEGTPGVTDVSIVSSPVSGDTYERGEVIRVEVGFDRVVTVTGAPQLALGIGTQTRQASYASGTGTASLVFHYTVVQADVDTDGISVGANALSLNSGTIKVAGGTTDAVLGLGASAIENSGSHKVAGGTLTASAVGAAAIASTPSSGNTYGLGEQIEVAVTFTRPVTVSGTPQLALGIGTETRQANYVSGTGTDSLTFRYAVMAADRDADGLSVGATALGLNSGTINDARDGTTAASLGLGTNAIANDGNHRVDGALAPPRVTGVAIGSPAVGDTFESGDTIEATVTFNKAVDVSGTPQLALGIGSQTRQASYASGTGTASLVFRYTVVQADTDTDGLSIGANALRLNSGTIDVAGGTTDALLGLGSRAIENSGSHKVAGGTLTAAAVSGAAIASSPASGSTYGLGEQIEVAVTFTRLVTVSGTPQLALGIGTETRQANYVSGTGTDSLTFRYAVQAADSDADGLSVGASALGLNSGTINDARDGTTAASLGLGTNAIANDGDHKVDGTTEGTPGVTDVSIVSSPVSGDTYERGEVIRVEVGFDRVVTVTGAPQLALGIGTQTRQASYASGTGTPRLVFHYTVVQADVDTDGISVGANALSLNSGTIKVAGGTTDALLGLGANAITNSSGHKVAGGTLTAAAVSGVAIASSPGRGDSTYVFGEQIEVAVTFTRPVTVTGAPQLALGVGTATRQASYASSPSTATVLVFRYTVQFADTDSDGLSVAATALTLNSGTINDARDGTTAASLGLGTNAIANDGDHKVDGREFPTSAFDAWMANSPVSGDTYERGEVIRVGVTFTHGRDSNRPQAVDVTGTPQLALGIGTQTRQASYASGTGTARLVFHYTVVQADVDTDGISVGANPLSLNGGTIKEAGGRVNARLEIDVDDGIENSGSHKVAGGTFTASAVNGAAIASSPASGSTYGLGERIEVAVTFTRPVTVSGAPQLALGIGTATRQANYVSGTGTDSLTFRYAVQAADRDADGLSVGASALGLNSGTINDARAGATAASLGLGTNAITNSSGHRVDGSQGPPGVTGVAIGAPTVGDTFERGDTIKATVTFNKAVDVSGTPQLALGIGTATRQASYVSGTGTATLVFRYVVVSGDADTDGLSIGADALGLNSGTIDVADGTTDALLGLGANAIENSGSHKVAGGTFTASAVSGAAIASTPASGSTYGLSEQIEVQLTFNRAVTVTGTPQLALGVGTATRQAGYASSPSTATVLVFRYTVQAADRDADGLSVGASALGLNSGTINDARAGATAASLGLGTNAIANDGNHRMDGSQGPPGVTGVALSSPVVGDIYERGERIEVTVTFNKAVDVSGAPQLALGIGTATRQASYASGTGSASLVFEYTVVQTDADADGLSIGADALGLNSGTIDVAGGTTDALLGLGASAIENSGSHKVAGGTFTASAVNGAAIASSPAGSSTYGLSEQIEVQLTFTRPVTVTGTPQLALGIGTATRQAGYASSPSTTTVLVFRYTVQAADRDADGLSVAATALGLNSGTINDARAGATAASLGLGTNAITNDGDHRVDGSQGPPGVTGVALSSPVVGDIYERGERIEVTVTFNKAVDVGGTPQLALGIGTQTRQASYASGTGTASLVFRYTVAAADTDNDGLSIAANALLLNSGSIDVAGGTLDALLGLGANAIENSSGHKVAGGTFTAAAVSGAAITSSPASGSTYRVGEQIEVAVTFTRPVTVSGTPQLALGIGSATRQAAYASSTATTLTFHYTVQASDRDSDGLSVAAAALTLNSGTINDARAGATAASLGLGTNAITNSSGHKVGVSQVGGAAVDDVYMVSSPVSGDTYERGEVIRVRVFYDNPVDVVGTPQLALGIGSQTRQANYVSSGTRTGTPRLEFHYTVVQADVDTDGISVGSNALSLNGGTIKVAGGTNDVFTIIGGNGFTNSSGHKVAGGRFTAAAVSGAAVASTPASGSTYGLGEQIEVAVTFTRAVTVSGTPQLALGIGTQTRQAAYASSTATTLTFRYAVIASDSDADGLSVGASALGLNSGTINDARAGATAASLGLGTNAIANDGDHRVDGTTEGTPAVRDVSIVSSPGSGDTYERGEVIRVEVGFDRVVTVTGVPQLALGIGTQTRQASYVSGTGTASLVFRYVVVSGDADADGISVGANALSLNSGTIKVAGGTTDALLGLGANAIENSGSHKVAGGTFTAPAVSGAAVASTPASGSTYGLGEQIEVTVTFNKAVDVSGTPQLALGIGTATRQASYASSPSTGTVLVFRYTVQVADRDADGISVGATALTLNGGTINDARSGGGAASLGLGTNAIANDGDHKVDGAQGPPGVTGVAIGAPAVGDTFERGDTIEVTVTFNKAVDVSGTPQLALGIGTATRQASYVSGTGTASLVFRYTVALADADTDGLSIGADALSLNSGTINDARDGTTAATLGLGTNAIANDGDHKVDGAQGPPGVTGVAIGAPVVGDTFERGEAIEATVTFNKAVDVSGTPQLALGIGSQTRQASYASGTGTASLVFAYTVVQADADTDGLSIGADALGLNSGTIDVAGGTKDALLGLGANAITNSSGHKVAGGTFTASAVSGAAIESSPASGSTYGLGEQIEVRLTFNRAVTVSGAPQLGLGVGTATRQASYASSPSTATVLVFRYTVQAADRDADGLSVGASALGLNSGTINDARAGATAASLGLGTNAIANDGDHRVDGSQGPPGVTGVAIGAPVVGDTFERGEAIEVTVTFNKAVDVSGTPQLALGIGTATRQASYASGTGTASLVFRYTVVSGDADADGVSIGADALGLNSGTIDVAGGTTDALLGLGASAIENSGSHKVAGGTFTASAVNGAAIASSPAGSSTYGLSETIEVAVTFTRPVTVTGTPQLALGIGTETRQANYVSGTGTDSLTFRYAVQAADRDADGLSVGTSALGLNSGTINDARAGATAASLGLGTNAIANDGDHKVDGSQGPPGVTGVAIGAPVVGDTFERGEAIEVTVTFNKTVDVGGTPQLALGIGTQTRQASYASGTGTASLVFRYVVVSGDADADGLSIGADALGLNSGTIDVAGGTTDALLGLGANAITNSGSHKVAGGTFTAAAVSGLAIASSPASGSTYGLGERIEVAVTFTRPVTVSGTPQLALGIGTETRQANYVSGTGTDSLTFRYAVMASDSDSDGLSVGASALGLNSGTINDARAGATAASLGLGTNAITNSSGHRVDGSQGPPGVTGVAIGAPTVGDTFERGDTIKATVTFNKAVDVSGTPQLALGIGTATRQASYVSGTGSASLVFRYVVVSGDADTDGLSIGADALGLNSGTIDVAGGTTDALLGLGANAIENSGSHKVAGGTFTASAVSGAAIESTPASGSTYGLSEQIEVRLTFNRAVTVTGTPQLALGIGTATRQAGYASSSSTATVLVFRYTVQAADSDADGLSVGASALGTEQRNDQRRARRDDGGEPRTGLERDHEQLWPQGGRCPGAAGRDGGGDRRAGGGRHVRAWRGDQGDGDVQQGGGRERDAAAGAGDRLGDAAGVLRLGHGHGVAGLRVHGGAGGYGQRRAQHRGGRAGAEQRVDRRGGWDDRCSAGPRRERDHEQREPQGGGRDVHGVGGERSGDREQPGERQHVRAGRADRGAADVQPGGDGERHAAAGAGSRHGDAAGILRLELEHGDGVGLPLHGAGGGPRRGRAQRRGECAGD